MKLVKLNAVNSTNSYLKELAKNKNTLNWTIVVTEFQKTGRGQMSTKWESKRGKNLIFSILIKLNDFNIEDQFYLNCAISLGIFEALKKYNFSNLKIKWPNDIMADDKKLGGILIENTIRNKKIYQTVVGIGININQEDFSNYLSSAISMKNIFKKRFDRSKILVKIITSIKEHIKLLEGKKFELLHDNYEQELFKKDTICRFESLDEISFLAKLKGVSINGKLIVEQKDKIKREFNFKEIRLIK